MQALYEPLPDPGADLERIGLRGLAVRQDLETLNQILYAHVRAVPFENLDAWSAGRVPSLGIRDLYDKVVLRRRGGWCHELNALLEALLRALGFTAYSVGGRVLTEPFITPIGHHGVICVPDGTKKYYCDVGFGDLAFQNAVALDGTPSAFGFRIERAGEWYRVLQGERPLIAFADLALEPVDFLFANFADASDPEGKFRKAPYVSILRGDARLLLRGEVLTEQRPGEGRRELLRVKDRDGLSAVLREYFGLELRGC